MTRLAAALSGAAVAGAAWLLLVPWDLSEVTADGRLIDGAGGDAHGTQVFLVGVGVAALGLIALARSSTRPWAGAFVAGGLGAWTVLFAWRAGSAHTEGANMFMAPLVVVFIPATILTPIVVRRIGSGLDRRQARSFRRTRRS